MYNNLRFQNKYFFFFSNHIHLVSKNGNQMSTIKIILGFSSFFVIDVIEVLINATHSGRSPYYLGI